MNEKSQRGKVLFCGRTDWLDTLSKTLLLLSLMSQQILAQVSGSLEIVNVTKDTIIFSDNFESGIAGGAPGADDPKVGT